MRAHHRTSGRALRRRVVELLRQVGIPDPARNADAFPHELSGGMRQRAMIAMGIANNPRLLIADEPTTALDVTIQAQVLELLAGLKRDRGMGLVFVTHSLPVVAEIADRVVVMYAGEIVETGTAAEIFARPLHPYTAALLRSAPLRGWQPARGHPGHGPVAAHAAARLRVRAALPAPRRRLRCRPAPLDRWHRTAPRAASGGASWLRRAPNEAAA